MLNANDSCEKIQFSKHQIYRSALDYLTLYKQVLQSDTYTGFNDSNLRLLKREREGVRLGFIKIVLAAQFCYENQG